MSRAKTEMMESTREDNSVENSLVEQLVKDAQEEAGRLVHEQKAQEPEVSEKFDASKHVATRYDAS